MVMLKQIEERMTQIVADYIQRGYCIYTKGMGWSGGEQARMVLSNGKEIIGIWLDEEFVKQRNSLVIKVESYSNFNTEHLRFGNYETVSEIIFYCIERNKCYTEDKDEIRRIEKLRRERLKLIESEGVLYEFKMTNKDKLLDVVRRYKGFQSVSKKDIVSVTHYATGYYIYIPKKQKTLRVSFK